MLISEMHKYWFHVVICILDDVHWQARLQKVTRKAQRRHDRVSKVLLDPLNKSPQIDIKGLKSVAKRLTGELKAALAGGLSEQSADVIAARRMLTSVQDQIRAADMAEKHKTLRMSLAAACDSARDLRQLAPLKEALAAALAGGGSAEWQEVAAAQELVAIVTKENELTVGGVMRRCVFDCGIDHLL